ncbi:MAG: carboxypeptidase regulatory-like domain-containing protein, partial [Deltaproteobacteria bacterium]|nr:carboxypeptidase regulatory-like domain-containing protein [Deltaproteobacteria bacterium]
MALTKNRLAVVCSGALLVAACQDALPGNPYDPRTSVADQARGEVKGTVLLDDESAVSSVIEYELGALEVRLRHGAEERLARCGEGSSQYANASCDPAQRTLDFSFKELVTGDYQWALAGVNPRYIPISRSPFELAPGEVVDLGILTLVPFQITDTQQHWSGRVTGVVELVGGGGSARRVTLLRQGSSGIEEYAARRTGSDGSFDFTGVPPGAYAAMAELDGFTPAFDTDVNILSPATPTAENTVDLSGDRALRLHPITGVIVPVGNPIAGRHYTNGDQVTLQVLEFGGFTEMRLATESTFGGDTLSYQPRADSTDLPLPDREGAIPIYAQFRLATDNFTFTTASYQAEIVRDKTMPAAVGVRVRGLSEADDGNIWLNQEGATIGLDIDGFDSHSAVHYVAVYHDENNSAGSAQSLIFTEQLSPEGLVRLTATAPLTGGEGEKRIFVYLQDRAGNLSAASDAVVWVDTIAPEIAQLVVNQGHPVTGTALVSVAIAASDSNEIVAMQVWEEGTSVPAPGPFLATTTLLLQGLDYGHTDRQVNAVVWDIAGNPSLAQAQTVSFDDRGRLHGTVLIESAADGSPGDYAGVAAAVNGVSYPVQFTAGVQSGEYDFVVSEVPAANNLRLTMAKAGYADAAAESLVSALAGETVEVGLLRLRAARGAIDGYARLAGESVHTGISVEVQGAGLVGITDVNGYFLIDGVPAGRSFTLVIRKDDDWTVETVSDVNVPAADAVTVSSDLAPILLSRLAGSFSIEEGSYTNQRTVTLLVSYQDAVVFKASERADFSDTSYATFVNQGCTSLTGESWACPFTLSDSDTLHHVFVQFSDPSPGGFESESRSDTITLDRQAPTNLVIEVNDSAPYSNTLAVTLWINGYDQNGLSYFQLAHRQTDQAGDLQESDWLSARAMPAAPFGELLPGALSYRTVRVWTRLIDVAGNVSAPALASFVLDPNPPTGGSITINGGDAITNSFTATLTFAATDQSPISMLIGDQQVPAIGTWEQFTSSKTWLLPPATEGTKTVCVAFRDAAGNRTQDYCDDIVYDSVLPPMPQMTASAGAVTRDPNITLSFGNVTADVAQIEIAGNAAFAGSLLSPAQTQVPYTLPDPDGTKPVYGRYLDAAGNASPPTMLSIQLDRVPPQAPSLAVAGGVTDTRLTRVPLVLGALEATEMLIGATADCSSGAWQHYATSGFVDLSGNDGSKSISVRYRDAALNETSCVAIQVNLDRQEPLLGATAMTLSTPQVTLNSAGTAVETIDLRIDFNVTGATQMKVSNQQGTPDATWQTFATPVLGWRVSNTEGNKTVFAVFKDNAGNTSAETSASLFVRTSGDITGTVTIEGGGDPAGVSFVLDGSPRVPRWEDTRFTIEGVLVNFYSSLVLHKAGYDDASVTGIQIRPGGSVDIGNVGLNQSRGNVEGYVQLAGASSHEGVAVELVNTGYTTTSNSAGYFFLPDVLVGSYDLRASRDGYSSQLRTSIAVATGQTTRVSTALGPIVLPVSSGDFSINENASYTSATLVHLNLDSPGAVQYRASESETFNGDAVPFTAYTGPGDYDFPLVDTQGQHTVYVQFHDGSSPGEVLQSSIILDTVAPTAGSVVLAGGAEAINVLNVSATLSSTDANGIAAIHTSEDGSNWSDGVNFQTPYTYEFSGDEGSKCLHVRYQDPAGNLSPLPAASDCIEFDQTDPTGSIAIVDQSGHPYPGAVTRSSGVYLLVTSTDA